MEEISVKFCAKCNEKIESRLIKVFFEKLVIDCLTVQRWTLLYYDDPLVFDFCKELESARLVVTHEDDLGTYATAPGLFYDDEGDVIVCKEPGKHLPFCAVHPVYK